MFEMSPDVPCSLTPLHHGYPSRLGSIAFYSVEVIIDQGRKVDCLNPSGYENPDLVCRSPFSIQLSSSGVESVVVLAGSLPSFSVRFLVVSLRRLEF